MTALLWCDKMYKNISKKLLHLTIEFFCPAEQEKYCLILLEKSAIIMLLYIHRCADVSEWQTMWTQNPFRVFLCLCEKFTSVR